MPVEWSTAPVDVEVDLDAAGDAAAAGAPAGAPRRLRSRRSRVAAVLVLVVAGAGLVVVQRVQDERERRVEVVAVAGELLSVRRPSSANYNTLVTVEVELRSTGPSAVTLRSVRTGGAGALLRDDLRGSGGEARALEQGTRMEPGEVVGVVLSGALQCPGAGAPAPRAGGLVLEVGAADRREVTVQVPAPAGADWADAFARACSLGPALGTGVEVDPYRSAF